MKLNFKSATLLLGLIVSTTFIFSSCKKPVDESDQGFRIKTVASTDDEVTFTYNPNGSIKSAAIKNSFATSGDLITYQISYNTAGKISEIVSDEDIRIVPIYSNGILAEASFETTDGIELFVTTYEYLNGLLKAVEIETAAGDPWTKFIFTYGPGGNVSKTETFLANPLQPDQLLFAGSISYTYDSKINPLHPARELLHLLWMPSSPNNILTEIHKKANNDLEETVNYTYQYHPNNTPKSAVVESTVVGEPPVNTNMTFTYF
jgi:hypothetical protein